MDVHCTISTSCMHASLVVQSCSTLCNPLDCSLSGSSVHGTIYIGVGCHALHQGIFQTQRSKPCPTSHVSPALQADSLPAELLVQFGSAAQSCPTLWDPMNCSMPGLPVHHQHPEFTQTDVRWVGDAIQPSHPLLAPSPPALNLSQHQGLFKWVSSSHQVTKVWEFQLQWTVSVFNEHPGLISFRMDWLDLLAVQGTLKSLLQHHSSKASILLSSAFFIVQLSHPYMITGKTIALTRQTFVDKVMSLLPNMLSRLVITFLPRSKHLLTSWLHSPSAVILKPRKIKSATVSTVSPSICHEVMAPDAMILVFWMLSFKPTF